MALAEARAAWQRTANRCLVQEDAKRAPKLACCSSAPPSAKQPDTEAKISPIGQDIPDTGSEPFNQSPSFPNLSPNSRWWLHLQPNYGFHRCLTDEQLNSSEAMDSFQNHESKYVDTSVNNIKSKENEVIVGYEVNKNTDDVYFDSDSSWVGSEKNLPWWRTADTGELATLVAKSSYEFIENCDLPRPQNTRVQKDLNVNMCGFGNEKYFESSANLKKAFGKANDIDARVYMPGGTNIVGLGPKLSLATKGQGASAECFSSPTPDRKPKSHAFENNSSKAELLEALRHSQTQSHAFENNSSKAELLEALRHSQTRAREAEKVAKQAYAEKEHVIKLVFRQASQLFAYKQWLHLLQLENMYFQFKNTQNLSAILPWTPQKTRKMRKTPSKQSGRKRAKREDHRCDVGKWAVALAIGLGLVGAGFLLGWSIGWWLW